MNKVMNTMQGKLCLLICFQALLGIKLAYATSYYVSPTGSNTNNGTSLSTAFKTITKALSKATVSGDIVYVTTGTYNEVVTIRSTQSGITLTAYPNNKPVIDGGTTLPSTDWSALITVNGNYNTVSGFEVKNSDLNTLHRGDRGIQVYGHHNLISKVNVHHAADEGIYLSGDYNTVEDSSVWQCSREGMANGGAATATSWGAGLVAGHNQDTSGASLKQGITSYPTFRRNKIFNNWGEGFACYEVDHCTMEDNIVYDNWTVNLYLSDATNSVVRRNMIYISTTPAISTRNNLPPPAILLADENSTVSRSAYNTVVNNFIYNADFDAFSWTGVNGSGLNNVLIANNTIVDGGLFTGAGGKHVIVNVASQIRNNIILGTDSYVPSNTGITFSNNNWYGFAAPTAAISTTSDVAGNPLITRTGTTTAGTLTPNYFKISTGSPVVNRAMRLTSVTEDFFKTLRSTTPDIGGHEAVLP